MTFCFKNLFNGCTHSNIFLYRGVYGKWKRGKSFGHRMLYQQSFEVESKKSAKKSPVRLRALTKIERKPGALTLQIS